MTKTITGDKSTLDLINYGVLWMQLTDNAQRYNRLRDRWIEIFEDLIREDTTAAELCLATPLFDKINKDRDKLWYKMYRMHLDNKMPGELSSIIESYRSKPRSLHPVEYLDRELVARLNLLVTIWREETMFSSRMEHEHFAYQTVIEMGKQTLPFLLQEMQKGHLGLHWAHALSAITRETPKGIPADIEQRTSADIVQAWIRWGIENGYLSE